MKPPQIKDDPPVFRCVHCGWTTRKWFTRKDGKKSSGWARVERHLAFAHGIEVDLTGRDEEDAA